jgi:hypothetical protein
MTMERFFTVEFMAVSPAVPDNRAIAQLYRALLFTL